MEDGHRFAVDSVLRFLKGANSFDSFLSVKPDSTIWNANKTELTEVFLMPKKEDIPNGRVILYYSKILNHLQELFNPIVDSVKRMKLFKTEVIFNKFYSEKDKRH